jgi:hypothetical protein
MRRSPSTRGPRTPPTLPRASIGSSPNREGTRRQGIVSKRLSAPYRSGLSRDWIKVKNPNSELHLGHVDRRPRQDASARAAASTTPRPRRGRASERPTRAAPHWLCCPRSQAGESHAKGFYTGGPTCRMGSPYSARQKTCGRSSADLHRATGERSNELERHRSRPRRARHSHASWHWKVAGRNGSPTAGTVAGLTIRGEMAKDRATEHRERAEECRRAAEAAIRERDKAAWLTLAEHWERLAELVEGS